MLSGFLHFQFFSFLFRCLSSLRSQCDLSLQNLYCDDRISPPWSSIFSFSQENQAAQVSAKSMPVKIMETSAALLGQNRFPFNIRSSKMNNMIPKSCNWAAENTNLDIAESFKLPSRKALFFPVFGKKHSKKKFCDNPLLPSQANKTKDAPCKRLFRKKTIVSGTSSSSEPSSYFRIIFRCCSFLKNCSRRFKFQLAGCRIIRFFVAERPFFLCLREKTLKKKILRESPSA